MASLDGGRSVVVCVPTGSGKTVIAEYAIDVALAAGRRVFYTTPLKALSNQKFRDLSARVGEERVGLLTGDVSIRRDAPVVVMTTEVCRNIVFGAEGRGVQAFRRSGVQDGTNPPLPERPNARTPERLVSPEDLNTRTPEHRERSDLQFIILDECHYINHAHRGTVWEETILGCPAETQLVALSATIANPEELAAWMARAHGPTDLILSETRPVPLVFHYFHYGVLSPLLESARDGSRALLAGAAGRSTRPWEGKPDADEVVAVLRERAMLPAIYFHFSRRGCEEAMQRCVHLELLAPSEAAAIESEIARHLEENPGARHHPHLRFLRSGLAVHHAGLLPRWKALVERLFQAGLVKVVFATETLSAGINMPARSTVISGLTKRAEREYRSLTPSEFTQMAGRAGRRGMDTTGHVVVVGDPFRPAAEAVRLATAPPDPLLSRFTPTYSLVLNLLRRHSPEEAEELLRHSFGQFLAEARRRRGASAPNLYTNTFRRLAAVLAERGYLHDFHPTEAGHLAAAFRAENELLVADLARSSALDELPAADLAAVFTALSAGAEEGKRGRGEEEKRLKRATGRDNHPLPLSPSSPLLSPRSAAALETARAVAAEIRIAQRRHQVDVPCRLVEAPCGIAQLWAGGASWEEVLEAADIDEGDAVYVLRSLIDLLGQLRDAPGVAPALRERAEEAIAAVDRDPVDSVM